jgi:hypothetical protein
VAVQLRSQFRSRYVPSGKLLNFGAFPVFPLFLVYLLNNELQLYIARKLITRNNGNKQRFQ